MLDIISLLQGTGSIDIAAVAVGLLSTFLIQGAKKVSFIPVNAGQTSKLRIVAAVLTFGGAFATAWASGDLTSPQFTEYLGVVADGVVGYFVAYLGYQSLLKDPNSKKDEEYTG